MSATYAEHSSLRSRFVAVFLVIFLGGAAAGYVVIDWFNRDLVRTLSTWFAEKNVLYEKSKVLQLLLREVVLAQKMASSPALRDWARDEHEPAARAAALSELEGYRKFFRSRSYFIVLAGSGNYYSSDGTERHDPALPRYTLSEANPKDAWFFQTLRTVRDYQLNVDTDRFLKVTRLWINAVLRDGDSALGVLGTGVDLSDFIRSVISTARPGVTNMLLDRNGAIQAHQDVSVIDFASIAKASRREGQSTVYGLIDDPAERREFRLALDDLAGGGADTHSLELTIQGKRHVAGITYLPDIKWFLVTLTYPELAADRPYLTAAAAVLVAALGVSLLAAALLLDRLVLRRLSTLDFAARRMAEGNYAVDLPRQGGDEIGRLGQSFRDMANRVATHTDELKRQVAERTRALEGLAYADFLTGLLNRRGVLDRITVEQKRLAREGGKLGVLILDIDHFKRINDAHGHEAGDHALLQVANAVRGQTRAYDLCARWGGEEFLVVLPGVADAHGLAVAAEKLRKVVAATPLAPGAARETLTASVGCYLADPSEDVDAMVAAADRALYAAKAAGRDRAAIAGADETTTLIGP